MSKTRYLIPKICDEKSIKIGWPKKCCCVSDVDIEVMHFTNAPMVCLSNFGSYQEIFLSRSFQKYWEIFLGVFSRCRLLSKPGCSLAHSFHQSTSHSEHSRRVHFKSFAYWSNKEQKIMWISGRSSFDGQPWYEKTLKVIFLRILLKQNTALLSNVS